MQTILRHYSFSFAFMAACLGLAAWYGFSMSGSFAGMAEVLWIVLVLSVLEISLSFDNAVVNASVLRGMDPVWQRRFLTWGIAFAVFGMRVVFPLAIVAIAAGIGPVEAARLSLADPARYESLVSSAHVGIAGFGGAFLSMVGLKFFFDADKDVHWIGWLERQLSRFAALPAAEIALLLLALWGISTLLPDEDALTFLVSGMLGLVAFIAVEGVNAILANSDGAGHGHGHGASSGPAPDITGAVVRSGLGGFIYLNVLDASFSFDGVIGAFALSNNMVVIALGLSIGAMFVRSMTIHLVKQGTLSQYRFLENGAFWAIIALGAIMLLSARFHIPESITGLIGAILIGLSLWWSVVFNRRNPDPADGEAAPGVVTPPAADRIAGSGHTASGG